MDPDVSLVLGLVVAAFSIPSILSAFADGRAPRVAALTILIGGGLILFALQTKPGGYTLEQMPNTFVEVIARFMP